MKFSLNETVSFKRTSGALQTAQVFLLLGDVIVVTWEHKNERFGKFLHISDVRKCNNERISFWQKNFFKLIFSSIFIVILLNGLFCNYYLLAGKHDNAWFPTEPPSIWRVSFAAEIKNRI
jgi:hypothetical protein